MMEKPQLITEVNHFYNYHDCIYYIENKYGYESRDFSNLFTTKGRLRKNKHLKQICKELDFPFDKLDDVTFCNTKPEERAKRVAIFQKLEKLEPPYQDFWHWIVDNYDINNGCYITMSMEQYDCCSEEWQKKIFMDIMNEFGGDKEEIKFYISW